MQSSSNRPPHGGGHPHENHEGGRSDSAGSHPHARDYAETPLVVTWEVTQACELACDHCRASAKPDRDPEELSFEEATDLFRQVATFDPQPFFVFTGGDPLQRPDVFELLERAVDVGVTPSITPATTPQLDRQAIERFAEIGVNRLARSLDGATAESHDQFRGESGTFEAAIEAAEHAADVGLSIQINTTVTASTVDELPAIADRVEELGAAMWEVFFLVPLGRGETLEQIAPERAREVLEWLYRRGTDAPFRVITVEAPFYRRVAREVDGDGARGGRVGTTGAGNGFVFVSHTGEVYPSGFLPKSAGNVRETDLPELYRNADLMERLRDRQSFGGPCGDCVMTAECGGSRSRAFAATGNPTGSDPLCPWATEER